MVSKEELREIVRGVVRTEVPKFLKDCGIAVRKNQTKKDKPTWCMGIGGHYTMKKTAEIADGLVLCSDCEKLEVKEE